jgi:DNA-binding transcriptional regulator YhcF (GntR family)
MAIIITQGIDYEQLLNDLRALIRHEMQIMPAAATQQPVGDELLTIKETAKMLGVCVATVHEYKRRGLLIYQKIGGRAYVRRNEVLAAGVQHQRTTKPARIKETMVVSANHRRQA